MPTGPGKAKTSLEIDEKLWGEAQIAAIRRKGKLNIRDMIEDALRLWMRYGEIGPDLVPVPEGVDLEPLTREELETASAAIALLREGTPAAVEILDTVLRRYRGKMKLTKRTEKETNTRKKA